MCRTRRWARTVPAAIISLIERPRCILSGKGFRPKHLDRQLCHTPQLKPYTAEIPNESVSAFFPGFLELAAELGKIHAVLGCFSCADEYNRDVPAVTLGKRDVHVDVYFS